MERKTVLHLIDTGGPGGAETIYLNLVAGLDRSRWRSVAVVPTRDWLHGALARRGIEPHVLGSSGAFDARYLLALLGVIRRERVDLVQAHLLASGVYGSLAAAVAGIPLVCTFHGIVDVDPSERLRRVKLGILSRRRNRVVFVSDSLRRAFHARGDATRARAHVVFNGIDAAAHVRPQDEAVRRELGVASDDVLVGAVGNIRPSKAYPVLLEAAALLRRNSPRAYRFVIVGDTRSPLHAELLEQRRALGLEETVQFTGFREDMHRLMSAFDVYALSSSAEGFSLSTVQALAAGVPVVATRCGGPEEILADGESGILVPTGNPAALASAIESIAADADRRRQLVEAGRRLVARRFTLEAMVRGYEAIYEEVTGAFTGSAPDSGTVPGAKAGA
jgi:glycosyltransferase involved in cell wall biosynthesis